MYGYDTKELIGTAKQTRGRVRGLVVDPRDVLELLRDTWGNVPVPSDAQFQGFGVQRKGADSYIEFYYTSLLDPINTCVTLKPQQLVDILKYWYDGCVPSDAEIKAVQINKYFTFIRLDVESGKFGASDAANIPLMHLRYEGGQLFTSDSGSRKQASVELVRG